GWSYGARQLRSQTLSLRTRDFLESARVRGERKLYVIVFEILPTMTSLIVATFLGAALYAVLFAAGLQFIGLGDPNSQSWGTMLRSTRTASSRCATSRLHMRLTKARWSPSRTSPSTSDEASSSRSSASPAAASRRSCTRSRVCSDRRSAARSRAAKSASAGG